MNVVKLFDEVAMMTSLKEDTIHLMKKTDFVEAIKRLIQAHDIIVLNLDIQKRFRSFQDEGPIWDSAALADLRVIRRELLVYYRNEFDPIQEVYDYTDKLGYLLHSVSSRKERVK